MFMNPLFKLCPEVFNWIQIWIIWWPIHYWYVLILKSFLNLFNRINTDIILYKRHIKLSCSRHLVVENCKIRVDGISWLLWIRISVHYDHIWTTISMNCTPYHNVNVFAFLIGLYHIFIPLLLWRTKDSNSSCLCVSFKTVFVTPYYLTSLIPSPISVYFRLCKSFDNHI